MSRKQQIIIIEPGAIQTEKFVLSGFTCPTCGGTGGFDYSGYMEKFKKKFGDPDWAVCETCRGTGKLKASITVEWVPEDTIDI